MGRFERFMRDNTEDYIISKFVYGNVLDLGCGEGRLYESLKSKSTSYLGIDIDKKAIAKAKKKSKSEFKLADYRWLESFKEESFDIVFCGFNVIDELDNINLALMYIYNILKEGGLLIFSTHNKYYWKHMLRDYPSNNRNIKPRMTSDRDIKSLLISHSFILSKKIGNLLSAYPYYIAFKSKQIPNIYIIGRLIISMNMKCDKCAYEWQYKGQMTFYATCPNCRKLVQISIKGASDGSETSAEPSL